jgi:acetylornithine deacetylase
VRETILLTIDPSIQQRTITFLKDLIKIPSTRGFEGDASLYAQQAFSNYCDSSNLVEIDDEIMDDPDYDFPLPDFSYRKTPQVEIIIKGRDESKSIVFNTHMDVVPPSEGQSTPFIPQEKSGKIFGRGAVDAKGQIAVLYTLAQILKESCTQPKGDLVFHLVVEEECGGNGTLAMVKRGVEADAAIVLEPSELKVIPAVRGAVWFQLKVFGKATHSGNAEGRISAIDIAFQAIEILRDYHDRLLASSRHLPLFDHYEDPMPLTIGQFNSGTWPATVPDEAILKGLIGFLPNKTRGEVQEELKEALRNHADEWLRNNFQITFPMLRNDGYAIPTDHPLVKALCFSLEKCGIAPLIDAMRASCDAWQYANKLNIPTLVFGPGSLSVAHSANEYIATEDIFDAARVLADFVSTYP